MPAKRKQSFSFVNLARKRWRGNKFTIDVSNEPSCSVSAEAPNFDEQPPQNARLQNNSVTEKTSGISDNDKQYLIVDTSSLTDILSGTVCRKCLSSDLKIHTPDVGYGFARKIEVKCDNCEKSGIDSIISSAWSSKRVPTTDSNRKIFDVNLRLTTAFLRIGKGYAGIEQFAMVMSMNPFSNSVFDGYMKFLDSPISKKSENTLRETHAIVKKAYQDLSTDSIGTEEIFDITVSFDGTWLTRGHISKYSVGCVIDVLTGYVIDYTIISKYRYHCVQAKLDLGEETPEWDRWMEGHKAECDMNHSGSSGAMEMAAAEKLWRRSQQYGLRYTRMLSDGDSTAFRHLNQLQVYGPDIVIEKEECVNHVSKRLGTALRNAIKEWRARGVTLGWRKHGSLKATTIKKLTDYYKTAIYRNKGDAQEMRNEILAAVYHGNSTDDKPKHDMCPVGVASWCFYNSALAKGDTPGSHSTKIRTALNDVVFDKILPIYERLSSLDLLRRCIECRTQNANECLHSMIWNKCPKELFVSKSRIQIAVAEAVAEFNKGFVKAYSDTMQAMSLPAGHFTTKIALRRDKRRIRKSKASKTQAYQVMRRARKARTSEVEQHLLELEGETYKAGKF